MKIYQPLRLLLWLLPTFCLAQPANLASISGAWQQEGYGRIMTIDTTGMQVYDHCAVSCNPSEKFSWTEFDDGLSLLQPSPDKLVFAMGINKYHLNRIAALPDLCSAQQPDRTKNPLFNFESVWHTFQENYPYFELRGVDWDSLGTKYRAQLSGQSTELELYLVLEAMLAELKDGHTFIVLPDHLQAAHQAHLEEKAKAAAKPKKKGKRLSINIDKTLKQLFEAKVNKVSYYNGGLVKWGMVNQSVAMVQINGMTNMANYGLKGKQSDASFEKKYRRAVANSPHPFLDEVAGAHYLMKRILADISDAEACIVDLRFNGGGHDEVALALLSHFDVQHTEVFTKKAKMGGGFTQDNLVEIQPAEEGYRGQVYLLTSHHTASAAEIFMMASKEVLPQAIRIGSPTEGITSDILGKFMPNGWYYGLSNEVYTSPNGQNYEGVGVTPHHDISYPQSVFWFLHKLKEGLSEGDAAVDKALFLFAAQKKTP